MAHSPVEENLPSPGLRKPAEGGIRLKGASKRSLPGKPLVSIITAVLNGGSTIEHAIRSVQGQTYDNIEYLIVDGGSSDQTISVLAANESAIDYWISEPDRGIYDAWNKAIALAKGDWLAFLGADDMYYPGAIADYLGRVREIGQELEFLSSKVEWVGNDARVLRVTGKPWRWQSFKKYMRVAHPGALHHKRLFEKYGRFDVSYRVCGDYELLMRAKENLKAGFLDKVTCRMKLGGISHNPKLVFDESVRAKRLTGNRNALQCYLEKYLAIAVHWLRNTMRRDKIDT